MIIKRLCIYFFYDKDGIVDRYVLKMLTALSPFFERIRFVSNGMLSDDSRDRICQVTPDIIERENVGFDVWAYKQVLESMSDNELARFDEIVMMNHTIMGPVYPFSEVFSEMERQDVDFWGLTEYHDYPEVRIKQCRYGHFPEHIQSHFIAVRKKLFSSPEFREYWRKMPKIKSYHDSVCRHEAVFTKYFSDKGYRWKVYADLDEGEHDLCPIIYSPARLLRETRCPVFKRRSFFHDIDDLQNWSNCEQAHELLELLESTGFDTGMIWENVLRTCSLADIQKCVGSFIIPEKNGENYAVRTALVMHMYYSDQISVCRRMADSMPKSCDIYITTPTQENEERIRRAFSDGEWNSVSVIRCENRGRDVSALLVAARDILDRYDLVCFAHDKKSHRGEKRIIGEDFSRHCFENILGSREYVEAVIDEFVRRPYLGILAPPAPYHSCYRRVVGNEWTCNYQQTKELAKSLGINVPMDSRVLPAAPLGTMFWFRPQALKPLLDRRWEYNDFPPEPNADDGTMLHAIERLYVYAAQQAGFYSAWCLRKCNVGRYMTMMYSMLGSEVYNRKYGRIRSYLFDRVKEFVRRKVSPGVWKQLKKLYVFISGR